MTSAKPATSTYGYSSGHCGVGRHDRCLGAYVGVQCTCPCHTEPVAGAEVTVHCALGCGWLVVDTDPQYAHDAMEQHYAERHPAPAPTRHCPTCRCGSPA